MADIRRHWSLVAWSRGLAGLAFALTVYEGFAGYVPSTAEAANDSGPGAA